MALVNSFEPNTKARQTVHGRTRCLYAIVEGLDGNRYLQLDTVGSEDRAIPDKVSQSIQFDRQAAGELLHLLQRTFPDLAGGIGTTATSESVSTDNEDEAVEGRTRLKIHRTKERNSRLVRRKKRNTLATIGRLLCEVCDFDFATIYGSLGDGFAECHHRLPLAELDGTSPTRLADLAIVCANCHRMLHRPPFHTVEQLRAVVQTARLAKTRA
ncbi:HNH endonuclease [Fimbriiglobus ruber]|uniref:HNH endonuclease n=1 Tax=Fimbriiglobus ruber TaxID=1908690 RepID=UPI000B4B584A